MKSDVLIFCTILFETIFSEKIQQESLKESVTENYYKNVLGHERYARHVQTVTESVIDHLLKEVKKRYSSNKELSSNRLSKIAQEISDKIKHLRKNKLHEEKASKHKKSHKGKKHKKTKKLSKTAQNSMKKKRAKKTGHHVNPKRSKQKTHVWKEKTQNNNS